MTVTPNPFDHFSCIIPAGGVGSRLWPLSRANAPKFLLDLTGSGQSLLRDTWDRLTPIVGADRIVVVTGNAHRASVREQLPDVREENVITENEPKDSSAAIGLAAALLELRDPDAIVGSFAADHVIRGNVLFERAVRQGVAAAAKGYIVTIGIQPTEPSTGFGYIKTGKAFTEVDAHDMFAVKKFVEKPNRSDAGRYVSSGKYLWNAGMFIARADLLLEQMAAAQPQLVANLREIAAAWNTERSAEVRERLWPTLPKIAIDYTVAEPAAASGRMLCVAGHFEWDDVGDFASVAKLLTRGRPSDLAILGDRAQILSDKSSGIIVSDSDRLIALVGVEDIVVVDTPDVLLVTTKDHAQQVKTLVDRMKLAGGNHLL